MPSIALAIVLVWLLWSWSGIRLLQELVVGDPAVTQCDDISQGTTIMFCISFFILVAGGLYMSEVLL
jgi:hypothetical protein